MTGNDSISGAEKSSYQTVRIPPDLSRLVEELLLDGDEGLQQCVVRLLEFALNHPDISRISGKELHLVDEFVRLLGDRSREYKAFRDMVIEVLSDRLGERDKADQSIGQPSGHCWENR